MANLENYRNEYAFTMTVESLGQIRVWKIEGRSLILLTQGIRSRIKGYPFMKVLVSKYATHLNLEDKRKKGEEIRPKEVEKLSSDEAEQIAEEIINGHEYLFVDRNRSVYTQHPPNEVGEELVEVSKKKLDIPRNEGESASDYLYRLVLALSEREEEEWKTTVKNVSEWTSKASSLPSSFVDLMKMPTYHIAPPYNPQYTTNERLSDVLEVLAGQKELNEQMVRTIEKNSTDSSRQVKISNTIAFLALLIALLTLVYTYVSNQRQVNQMARPEIAAPASPESPQAEPQAEPQVEKN